MRQLTGCGTPRGLHGRVGALTDLVTALAGLLVDCWADLPGTTPLSVSGSTYTTDDLARCATGVSQ